MPLSLIFPATGQPGTVTLSGANFSKTINFTLVLYNVSDNTYIFPTTITITSPSGMSGTSFNSSYCKISFSNGTATNATMNISIPATNFEAGKKYQATIFSYINTYNTNSYFSTNSVPINTNAINNFSSNPSIYTKFGPTNQIIYCLFEDSEVLTPSGYKSVKLFKEGDVVITSAGKESKIMGVFTSVYPNEDPYYPLIIHANSIAPNYPPKDCRITKWHMIKYNDDWILPWKNDHVFKYDKSHDIIKYYHFELEDFINVHLVINGGLVVESKGNSSKEEDCKEWKRREDASLIL